MKNLGKLALILSLFMFISAFVGCASNAPSINSEGASDITAEESVNESSKEIPFEEKILGNWKVISLESDKNTIDFAVWQEQLPEGSGIEFTEDNLYLEALTLKMDYKIEGTKVFLKQPTVEEYDPKYIEVDVDENTMVWNCSGVKINFERIK